MPSYDGLGLEGMILLVILASNRPKENPLLNPFKEFRL